MFKADSLQCQVFLNPMHMQSLHIKVLQIPPMQMPDGKQPFQWNLDDLHVIEKFFDTRVVAPPYRPNALWGFGRMLNVPPPVLRDFIQIIRLELMPDLLPGIKWHVQFCMRSPPSAVPVVPTAVVMIRTKILFFVSFVFFFFVFCAQLFFFFGGQLQITRIPYMPGMEWKDSASIVLPMVYDVSTNMTQMAERRETGGFIQSISTAAVSNMLRRFADYSAHHGECSIFPAVRDLLMNLTLPNEPQPPPQQQQQQMQQQQNQVDVLFFILFFTINARFPLDYSIAWRFGCSQSIANDAAFTDAIAAAAAATNGTATSWSGWWRWRWFTTTATGLRWNGTTRCTKLIKKKKYSLGN